MTRKGKQGKGGVEGREYLISKSRGKRRRVSLTPCHRLAAAALGIPSARWADQACPKGKSGAHGPCVWTMQRTKTGQMRGYCSCALHCLAVWAKRGPGQRATGWPVFVDRRMVADSSFCATGEDEANRRHYTPPPQSKPASAPLSHLLPVAIPQDTAN